MNTVGIIEALYRLDLPNDEWFASCARALQPLLDENRLGAFGGWYDCRDPYSFRVRETFCRNMPSRLEALVADFGRAARDCSTFIEDSFLRRPFGTGAGCSGWNEIETVSDGSLRATGAVDSVVLNAIEPTGAGIYIGSFRTERIRLDQDTAAYMAALGGHLAAAHRLRLTIKNARLTPETVDAVLDSGGVVRHAVGTATERDQRHALARAVRQMEMARSQCGRDSPDGHTNWPALVAGRWTLVDHFERDGRRYLLAVENRPTPPGLALLSDREREVLRAAMRGLENKVIAYDLGIAHSTVKVLLHRAANKMGVRTRRELLERAGDLEASAPETVSAS